MRLIQTPARYFLAIPAPIRLLSLGVFINQLGGYVAVFLALILSERGFNSWHIGLALALVAITGVAGSAAGGMVASRIGSRQTIILSTSGSAVFTALLAPHSPFPVTAGLACCVSLFNRGYVPASYATVGELAPPGQQVPMFGYYQLAFNAGAAAGPLIAGFLLTRSLTALLLIDSVTSACYAVAALRLPNQRPARRTAAEPGSRPARRAVLADRQFLVLCVAFGLVAMCYGQQAGTLPLGIKAHHYNLELLGALFTGNAIAVILFQLPVSILTRRLPARVTLSAGATLICGGYAIFLLGMSVPTIIVNVCLWTSGELLVAPVAPAVAMSLSSPDSHNSYQGVQSVFRTAGQTVGPAAGVFAYTYNASLPWLGCGIAGIAAVSIFFPLLRGVSVSGGRAAEDEPQPEPPEPPGPARQDVVS